MKIFPSILDVICHDIHNGVPLIVVDSLDRENEGDLVIAAEAATLRNLAFIARHARGIMCIPTAGHILDRLEIPMSPSNSLDKYQTPFTVSIDAATNVATGVSVTDRLETIRRVLDPYSVPSDFAYPGHLFPLRPKDRLLEDRRGHTEASIELMKLAGKQPVAIICEVMNDDGSMAKMPELEVFAGMFGLQIVTIDDIYDTVYGS
jgi:3,4-dihydroxy-2-butanone 4-phosphate synthase